VSVKLKLITERNESNEALAASGANHNVQTKPINDKTYLLKGEMNYVYHQYCYPSSAHR
jgi:hypothetical protein